MISSYLLVVLVGGITIGSTVIVFLFYFQGSKGNRLTNNKGLLARLRQRKSFRRSMKITNQDLGTNEGTMENADFLPLLGSARDSSSGEGFEGEDSPRLAELYRRVGKRQKAASIGFVVASVVFLVLSLPFKSVVLEIDSVVSFAVAAILLLKESRNRVQSRVLNAVVSSLGTTIAELSSRAGSGYLYAPLGKTISDVVVMGTKDPDPIRGAGSVFVVVPPGMGLAKLFAREAEKVSITRESLDHLLPSVINENFGLAEAIEVTSLSDGVEVLLRKPAIFCSCQKDELRRSGVVGCTISSFLAVLYSFGSQRTLSLDRCKTDSDAGTWRISMTLEAKAA